jgi:hypothetical protein
MEISSKYYNEYLNSKMRDIPSIAIIELIDEFSANAKFYMSSDADAITTEKINNAVVDLLKGRFSHMPFSLIAEAYTKGALGELGGTTRFTVRNVYTWLNAMEEKYQRLYQEMQTKTDAERRAAEEKKFMSTQKRSNIYGAAMYRKIEWCHDGLLTSSQYDILTLDKIVAAVEMGYSLKELKPSMIL